MKSLLRVLLAVVGLAAKHKSFVDGAVAAEERMDLRMPDVHVSQPETYLCYSVPVADARTHFITGFEPHSTMQTAHHMLIFGCAQPGSRAGVWKCGEMQGSGDDDYAQAPVCESGLSILYAWARDAPALTLPEGVGFAVSGDTDVQHIVLQVHYMHGVESDASGVTLHATSLPLPRVAQTLLMSTGGVIRAKSDENFESACAIDEPVVMHPFAYRVHTHTRGKVVSGYVVTRDYETGRDHWTLLGKNDPMRPEMFYPVDNTDVTIEQGDVVAARCTMHNEEDRDIYIGATGKDEMCNFYLMYWTDANAMPTFNQCTAPGPPYFYWSREAELNSVPADASSL